jgi:diaminohydroxyphosphoribosylaminopyrimidine deaminase/5-amino-6-(5-phosphoribosylamino)uracil reductase
VTQDEKYMRAALKLARRGISSVEPNPAVGCLIVKAGQIIGRGWHKKYGGPHAEVNALEDCGSIGANPQGATMYVTLEPCCHQGRTPPCTRAVIDAGIGKVIAALIDPSEHARGAGLEQLRNAAIEVQLGVCETEARLLNAPFLKFTTTSKCWTILKWAQSIDGKLAYAEKNGSQKWISGELSRKDAHRLRRRVQAIIVGINTVIADDPLLTPRPSEGREPVRVVLDSSLRIPLESQLLKTAKKSLVIVYASREYVKANPKAVESISQKGAKILAYPEGQSRSNLHFLLKELSRRGLQQVLVEGGPRVVSSFLKENLADELYIYIAPKILGRSGLVGIAKPMAELVSEVGLRHVNIKQFDDDVCLTGITDKALREMSVSGS